MRLFCSLCLSVPFVALATLQASDASACGGCFVPESDSTQVVGHRMALSISPERSTLWDQIEYSGNPAEFAWVLPTKGLVEIGLSSDALFAFLEEQTRVTVVPPQLNCPYPTNCWGYGEEDGASEPNAGGAMDGGAVEVIAQEVVGPYETVQLSSDDPAALKTWLLDHGYAIPPDISPVIDAYVNEGFNFLALKLVPGEGVDSMRPVRVTTPGASAVLPLRMVAAGTGAVTRITLWVVGEGRYEPTNFEQFTIGADELVWDWDAQQSNYATLAEQAFEASAGAAWQTESAEPHSRYDIENPLCQVACGGMPELSGYGAESPCDECYADTETLFGGIPDTSLWLTRLHGRLSRAALASDLFVGASASQDSVPRFLPVTKTTGTVPECPEYPPCGETGPGENGGVWDFFGEGSGDGAATGSGEADSGDGCAMGRGAGVPIAAGMTMALAAVFARRRRRSR